MALVLHIGDFSVDFGSRHFLRGTRGIRLGPKAFELLEGLLGTRPRAWSKAQLLERPLSNGDEILLGEAGS